MARRVRGYVLDSKRRNSAGSSVGGSGSAIAHERNSAGHHGTQRRPKGRNSAGKRIPTGTMHKGRGTKACVLAVAAEYLVETGVLPAG